MRLVNLDRIGDTQNEGGTDDSVIKEVRERKRDMRNGEMNGHRENLDDQNRFRNS